MGHLLSLLVPVLALGASNLEPMTIQDPEPAPHRKDAIPVHHEPGELRFTVGTVDTVGGTTYDWQSGGPMWRYIVNSPEYGLHVAWLYSASNQSTFPDRTMRYNFYDYTAGAWSWLDPDYMASGIIVFTDRCGCGSLDADPNSGCAIVSSHTGDPIHPIMAGDVAPGSGTFGYCSGSPTADGYMWVAVSVDSAGKPHTALVDDATCDQLYYSGVDPWCTWSTPYHIPSHQPDPGYMCQNIAASKVSRKVCVTWVSSNVPPDPGFYRISTDGGTTWGAPTELPWPDAYGGDTVASYHISSLFPFYDREDRLHIAASVMPCVDGTGYISPAQIWHWCPENTPAWSLVTIAEPESLLAPIGYNAIFASRPSLGEDNHGNIVIAWEQFDGEDMVPGPPELVCSDVYVTGSADNGRTWDCRITRLTDAEGTSFRFPCIVDLAVDGDRPNPDTICVVYHADLDPGFFVQGQGTASPNPVLVHRAPSDQILVPAVAEETPGNMPVRIGPARPNPFRHTTVLGLELPATAGSVRAAVYNATGRRVALIADEDRGPGEYALTWTPGPDVQPGVYYLRCRAGGKDYTQRLVLVE